ncbi:MAG: class I SAM-dependent methyltransferase [Alistipes sp.]|nr:class I SAM-dependent methyltransferase [Alistipes sp.]
MKRLIRWALNRIPRPMLQRAAGWAVPMLGLLYKGRGVQCPVCGARYRKFLPYGYVEPRPNALCPRCLSLERHRLLWLYLERETDLLEALPRTLHIAPEVCLERRLQPAFAAHPDRYVTADLESPLAELHFDVQEIPLADETFGAVICNHLLEHVADDRRALRELYRVLRPGGWGILLSPVDLARTETYEDDTVVDPAERTRIFGQYDHRRIYGTDYAARLCEAGFEALDIDYASTFDEADRRRYALPADHIYVVRKRADD